MKPHFQKHILICCAVIISIILGYSLSRERTGTQPSHKIIAVAPSKPMYRCPDGDHFFVRLGTRYFKFPYSNKYFKFNQPYPNGTYMTGEACESPRGLLRVIFYAHRSLKGYEHPRDPLGKQYYYLDHQIILDVVTPKSNVEETYKLALRVWSAPYLSQPLTKKRISTSPVKNGFYITRTSKNLFILTSKTISTPMHNPLTFECNGDLETVYNCDTTVRLYNDLLMRISDIHSDRVPINKLAGFYKVILNYIITSKIKFSKIDDKKNPTNLYEIPYELLPVE